MKVAPTNLKDCYLIEPKIFGDERGFFFESFNQKTFAEALGFDATFVQDNHSKSMQGVLRGLHYQTRQVQGKLLRVIEGSIFDVAVDIRKSSPSFGNWFGIELSATNFKQLWVPPGFAHGFLVLSPVAQVLYKTTDYYDPTSEVSVRYDAPELGIEWPHTGVPVMLSAKDQKGISFSEAPLFD